MIKFGTHGWRAVMGEEFTFQNVRIVSQAIANYIKDNADGAACSVVLNYDTRFLSERFAFESAKVLSHNKIHVFLSDRDAPSQAQAYQVIKRSTQGGINFTASFNPPEYNGFKIKTSSGGAAGPEVTKEIENLLGKNPVKEITEQGAPITSCNLIKDYVQFIRKYIDLKRIKNKRFKVLVDAMYGSGDSLFLEVLKETKIRLSFIRNTINPSFGGIGPEPIEGNLQELKERVRKGKFDIGIALDGDADRIACVAGGGVFIHPQKMKN